MDNPRSTLTLHDYPTSFWLIGFITFGVGCLVFHQNHGAWMIFGMATVSCLLILVLAPILVLKADRTTGILTLTYLSLVWRKVRQVPIREVSAISLEQRLSLKGHGRLSMTYRTVVILTNREVIPFRTFFNNGRSGKLRKARALREFLGVGGMDGGSLLDLLKDLPKILEQSAQQVQQELQESYQRVQQELKETLGEEITAGGVRFQVQRLKYADMGVVRLFTPERKTTGFLYLGQKPTGQASPPGGIIGSLLRSTLLHTLKSYGFTQEDMPGMESGLELKHLDPPLGLSFAGFTNDPSTARQILTPGAIGRLADWASRHPLVRIAVGNKLSQISVLFSPRGLYVCCLGRTTAELLDEMTGLGADLVAA